MYPVETRAEVLKMLRSGATNGEITRKFGVGRQTIYNWRKNPTPKTHAKHRSKYSKARDLLDAGLTRTATAEKLGVSRDALRMWEREGRLPPSYAEKRASGAITGPLLLRDEDFRVLYGQFKTDAAMALEMLVDVEDVVEWRERNGLPERIPPPKEQMSRNDHAALKRKMARQYWNDMMKWGVVANPELTLVDVFDYIRGGIMEQDYHVSRTWVRAWYENTLVPFGWPSTHRKKIQGPRKSHLATKRLLRLMAEEGLKG
jgi:DNA-binding XRE family transcriptional regulator|tara:strand:+ start:535 stop:1311 length:777 start_codon:yes stop_codon:yes gene_type:complete